MVVVSICSDFNKNFRPKFTTITSAHLVVTATLQPANFARIKLLEMKPRISEISHRRFDVNFPLVCCHQDLICLQVSPWNTRKFLITAPEFSWSEEIIKLQRLANYLFTLSIAIRVPCSATERLLMGYTSWDGITCLGKYRSQSHSA